jgi:hypothetical protein
MEDLASNLCEALLSEGQASLDQLNVRPLVQRVLDNLLILLNRDRASGVDNVTASLAVMIDRIDGRQDQLLLQMRKLHEIRLGFVLHRLAKLDSRIEYYIPS